MQGALRDDKLARRIVTRHIIRVDVVGALVVVDGLQLEARVVVGKDVRESVLGTIAWKVSERAGLVTSDVLQLFKLLAESKRGNKVLIRLPTTSAFEAPYLKSESADIKR